MSYQINRLYNWVKELSESQYSMYALFIISILEASIFPIPPDVLLIGMSLASRNNIFKYFLICSIGSILGAILGYLIGNYLWWNGLIYSNIANFFFNYIPGFSELIFNDIKYQFEQYNFIIMFTAGFTPIPFKIFTISAGAFKTPFILFLLSSAFSRTLRFFIISILIWKFGNKIKIFIDKYFNILSIVCVLLLFGGFLVIKYFF